MSFADLTPSVLRTALLEVALSSGEQKCAQGLNYAAGLIQAACAQGISNSYLMEMLDSAATGIAGQTHIDHLIDRTLTLHNLPEGGHLLLCAVPVAVATEGQLFSKIALKPRAVSEQFLQAKLQAALQLNCIEPSEPVGWVRVVPALYTQQVLEDTPLTNLVNLPKSFRDHIRGTSRQLVFEHGPTHVLSPGLEIFYLPVVGFCPGGRRVRTFRRCDTVSKILKDWILESIKGETSAHLGTTVEAAPYAVRFCNAFKRGYAIRLEINIRAHLQTICSEHGIQPSGLTARAAILGQGTSNPYVSVLFQTPLKGENLSGLNIQFPVGNGMDEMMAVLTILREAGIEELHLEPLMAQGRVDADLGVADLPQVLSPADCAKATLH